MNLNMVNRRKLGMLTAAVSLIVAVVEGALSLVRTREILFTFGDSTNAILQVAVQITAYLVLIESGMTVAYQLKLYKPLEENDTRRISALFWGLQKNLRSIVIKMLIVANICSFVYVFFLLNTDESSVYAFAIFFVMGLRFVSPYFFTLQERTILLANERGYIATAVQGILQCGTLLTEILLCKYTDFPLPIILFVYIIGVIFTKLLYVFYRKKFMGLKLDHSVEADLEPTGMTRDILVHQVSGMISSNTDNILLSVMNSLTNVTIYSSFSTVMNYPISLFNSIISSMKASVIIKIQKREKNAFDLYENVMKLSCYIMAVTTSVFFVQINKFIDLWIGERYELNDFCVLLFSIILFTQVVFNVLTIGVDAEGLYKETKKYAIAQAVTNFVLTLMLIPVCGIAGALIGTVVSVLVVKYPFMSMVVYRDVFHKRNTSIQILLSGVTATVIATILQLLVSGIWNKNTWITFILSSLVCGMLSFIAVTCWYIVMDRKMMRYFFGGFLRKLIAYKKSQ